MSIEQRLLNLYTQYKTKQIKANTVIAIFDALVRFEENKALYDQFVEGKWECYDDHCCSQCCDCEWDEEGYPL